MGANDKHTDGIFWVISREATYECKFIKTSFIVVVLKDIVSTSLFYTSLFERQSQFYGIVRLCCVAASGATDICATISCATDSPEILLNGTYTMSPHPSHSSSNCFPMMPMPTLLMLWHQ